MRIAGRESRRLDCQRRGSSNSQNPQEGHRYRLPVKKEKDELRRRLKLRSAQSQNGRSPKRNSE